MKLNFFRPYFSWYWYDWGMGEVEITRKKPDSFTKTFSFPPIIPELGKFRFKNVQFHVTLIMIVTWTTRFMERKKVRKFWEKFHWACCVFVLVNPFFSFFLFFFFFFFFFNGSQAFTFKVFYSTIMKWGNLFSIILTFDF